MDRYIYDTGLDIKLFKPLLFMWWVTYMNDMLDIHRFNPAWKKLRAAAKADTWRKIMKA
jgi:hypothetical protein